MWSKSGVKAIGTNFRMVHPLVAEHICQAREKLANLAISQEMVELKTWFLVLYSLLLYSL